jgi:hypothetical protein
MKRALSIVLVFLALTNIVGFMPLYFSGIQEIKSEVKLKISDESGLQKLLVSDDEYNNPAIFNKTDDDEFNFRGRMYDYKTVKKATGGYIFYTLEDNKETNLIGFLKAVYSSDESSKNTKAPLCNLLKNFSKDFVGSFSKISLPALPANTYSVFVALRGICTGYFISIQNPPD